MKSLLLTPLFLPLLAACGDIGGGARTERTDSAGVVLVTNTAQDRPLAWTFEPELTLGGEDFYRVNRWLVDADARGVIHVLDREGKRVLRYEPDGTPLGTLGGPGQGPGELEWPNIMDVAPDGRVSVSDFGRGRVITWGADGSLLGEDAGEDPGGSFRRLPDGEVREVQEWESERTIHRLVHIREGEDTTVVASIEWTGRPITLESCGMRFSGMPAIFTPTLRWDASGGRISVAAGSEYEIRVSDAGQPTLYVRRRLTPPEATEALALLELGEGMAVTTSGGRRVCEPSEVIQQRGLSRVVPLIEQVVLDPDGRIWAQRFVPGEEPGPVDLFEADGEYLGTLPPDRPLPIGFLPDGRIMTAETDAMDIQRLVIGRYVQE